jgi:hypothetical protein
MNPKIKEAQENYVMPPVEKGDDVLFRYGDSTAEEAVVAKVLEVGTQAITCAVMTKSTSYYDVFHGVKHATDPTRRDLDGNGVWDYTPRLARLIDLEEKVTQLLKEIGPINKSR